MPTQRQLDTPPSNTAPPDLLTVAETAAVLRCGLTFVYESIHRYRATGDTDEIPGPGHSQMAATISRSSAGRTHTGHTLPMMAGDAADQLSGVAGWMTTLIDALGPIGVGIVILIETVFPATRDGRAERRGVAPGAGAARVGVQVIVPAASPEKLYLLTSNNAKGRADALGDVAAGGIAERRSRCGDFIPSRLENSADSATLCELAFRESPAQPTSATLRGIHKTGEGEPRHLRSDSSRSAPLRRERASDPPAGFHCHSQGMNAISSYGVAP